MFCSSCGNQIPNDAKFCHYCAHPVVGSSAAPVNDAAGQTIIINQGKEKTVSASGIVEAFFAVVLIAALAIGGLYYYQKYQNENKPVFQINRDGSSEINLR